MTAAHLHVQSESAQRLERVPNSELETERLGDEELELEDVR